MASEQAIDRAIDALYTAAVDPAGWPLALQHLNRCFDAAASCVFVMDNATQRVPHWVGLGLDAGAKDYREHYAAIDPRARYAAANPQSRIHHDHMLIDERGMDRSEFYDWQSRSADGLRYFIGCRIDLDGDHTGFAALHWHRRHGHADASDIRLFKRLAPHFERALQLSQRLGIAGKRNAAMAHVFDELAHAMILLDASARVVALNRAAEAVMSANDGLDVTGPRLSARCAADDAALQRLIGQTTATPPGAGGTALVTRASGCTPYVLTVTPLPRAETPFAVGAPVAAVCVTDPEQRREASESILRRVFGLTPAESALAARLLAGKSLNQAAVEAGISPNTARLHLQRIMRKTQTHRQSELLGLLLRCTPIIRPSHV